MNWFGALISAQPWTAYHGMFLLLRSAHILFYWLPKQPAAYCFILSVPFLAQNWQR